MEAIQLIQCLTCNIKVKEFQFKMGYLMFAETFETVGTKNVHSTVYIVFWKRNIQMPLKYNVTHSVGV